MQAYAATKFGAGSFALTLQSGTAPAVMRLVEFRRSMNSTNVTVTRNRGELRRSTGGVTPTNVTEDKLNSRSPANASNVVSAWGTAPTQTGSVVVILYNGWRQTDAWTCTWRPPRPCAAPILQDAEQDDVNNNGDTGGGPAYSLIFSESISQAYAGQRMHRRPRSYLYPFRNSHTKSALATSVDKQNRTDEGWMTFVRIPRAFERGIENWIAFYGTAGGTQYTQGVDGTLSSSGALVKQDQKPLAGTLTSTGALIKQTAKAVAGTLSSSGALTAFKVALISIGGTLTSSGMLVKRTAKAMGGTMTGSGALVKRTSKAVAGTLGSSGALAAVKAALVSVGGTLSSSGLLVKQTQKSLAGTLTSAGSLAKRTATSMAGTLSGAGSLSKQTAKAIGGILSSLGDLLRSYLPGTPPSATTPIPLTLAARSTTGTLMARALSATLATRTVTLAVPTRATALTIQTRTMALTIADEDR